MGKWMNLGVKVKSVLDYEFSCIFERYRDLPSVLLPQTKLKVYNVFLRRSYNCVSYKGLNFGGFGL